MALILLVEDEDLLRWTLERRLAKEGHTIHGVGTVGEATRHIEQHQPDVLLLDLALPDGHGLDFYERNRDRLEVTVTIVMTAVGSVEDAVRAMKLGVFDFLTKPVDHADLVALVNRSLERREERLEADAARHEREVRISADIVAHSQTFRQTLDLARQVAKSEVNTILITGETGSGKNVVARSIHAMSERRERPLLEVNCAALPDQLVESELFGHEKGAFTDAKAMKRGTLELADGGTVVLDEIGELRLDVQSKLLQFQEMRWFRRVGGLREIQVDTRVIALTNRDLKAMVAAGDFRADLFYRLSVFPIEIPPLRRRQEDILPLANFFLRTLQPKLGRQLRGFTREAENRLLTYSWPGNVRELRNVVERAMILSREPMIGPHVLLLDSEAAQVAHPERGQLPAFDGIIPLERAERELVERAMRATGNNQTRAAELLGISRDQLRYRLKKFGMTGSGE